MAEPIRCPYCGSALGEIHNYWGRVEPGSVVPLGRCPNAYCGALCYPPYGYVHELEQKLAALEDVLARLITWADYMGGWEAPVWEEARRLLGLADTESEDVEQSEDA